MSNVLFLNYEDMLVDLPGTVKNIGQFLDSMPNAEGLEQLLHHLSIKNFRENKSVNMHEMAAVGILNQGEAGFVRRGGKDSTTKTNDQQEFVDNPKILQSANDWIQQNIDFLRTM